MIRGRFVAVFPYYGGWSDRRIRRALYPVVVEMAGREGVSLLEEPSFRLDRTTRGYFVVVQAPATTTSPIEQVRAAAEHLAHQHEQAHPALSRWITGHLQEAAA